MAEPKIAKTEILILSGGVRPLENNVSQYYQTRGLSDFFSGDSDNIVTTLFGGGRRPGGQEAPDVIIEDPEIRFIRGEIAGNISATLGNIRKYFASLGVRNWMTVDRFVLFVTDHGSPNNNDPTAFKIEENKDGQKAIRDYDQNCISIWRPGTELYPEQHCLSVYELDKALQTYISPNVPVNFVMTQCFSGAFHLMGYTKGERGFPEKKKGEVCGFTAITADTTASGCTPSIEEAKYDGYERRIAEAVTGRAVLSGKVIASPIPWISDAHDQAMLLDHTKDVPLRTSDAYLLDYMDALDENFFGGEGQIRTNLDQLLKEADFDGIAKTIPDVARRLKLIRLLSERLEEWHTAYRGKLKGSGIVEIAAMRESLKELTEKAESYEKKDAYEKAFRVMEVHYLHDLKTKNDPTSKERMTFEVILDNLGDANVYYRLKNEDPSLETYARYQNYVKDRRKIMLEWAKQNPAIVKADDIKTVTAYASWKTVSEGEVTQLEITEGELRRLQTQMEAVAIIAWLIKNNEKKALADVGALIDCELRATVNGR